MVFDYFFHGEFGGLKLGKLILNSRAGGLKSVFRFLFISLFTSLLW